MRALVVVSLLLLGACAAPPPPAAPAFDVVEKSIPELQDAMARGDVTARELVLAYLHRIGQHEDLRAVMALNPEALAVADRLDAERAAGRVRGPLHGIPIALKDNINTTDMPTTGGALAFDGFVPPYDATLVTKLRDAGAIIIAKTTHTELAHWVATDMPGGYSALGGQGVNPYGRSFSPGGSSSGIGTAMSFWAASVGTETSGSILNPANATMLAAVKPTVGRVSRHGIMPITLDQDTAGPMARTVADAALLLGAIEGPDANDEATGVCPAPPDNDYTPFLQPDALAGARIGIPRAAFQDDAPVPGNPTPVIGLGDARRAAMMEVVALLRARGAFVVEPADIPSVVAPEPDANFHAWPVCYGDDGGKGNDDDCSVVFKYGMKRDFNAYLASLGPTAPVKTLTELRRFNLDSVPRSRAIRYGQIQLDISDEMDVERDRARYLEDRAKDIRLAAHDGIDAPLREHGVEVLVFPGARGAAIAARAGYPSVIVPFRLVDDGEGDPAPFGVAFTGPACSEPLLLAVAYAFEQATRGRVPPPIR